MTKSKHFSQFIYKNTTNNYNIFGKVFTKQRRHGFMCGASFVTNSTP